MVFDKSTGLVWVEEVVSVKSRSDILQRIDNVSLGGTPVYRPPNNGCETLQNITMRKLLCSLDLLEADSLSTVPDVILNRIWKRIKKA